MEKQTAERVQLYEKVEPSGEPIPINAVPFAVPDAVPGDLKIPEAVKDGLKRGRAGGALLFKAEHIKQWLKDMEEGEKAEKEEMGDKWQAFVRPIQMVWKTGDIPRQMMWVVVVLLPKGGGNFRGIGLLEPFWKVLEIIMDRRLQVVTFRDCLHGFVKGRGYGTAGLEAKLVQQLVFIKQHSLFMIFIDLKKACDAMDRGQCKEILVGYGIGPNMIRLIMYFWDNAVLVCRASGRYGQVFRANRGVTQGGPLSPKLFNIVVDAIV
mmetsp:Transcript_21821/g.47506  ORF Transcript_21821/g.47506 Transcript_21821/m.47506 type:complete len:265 (+) Transcript_21821:1172-1966(+)